jgi:hypothetical protein
MNQHLIEGLGFDQNDVGIDARDDLAKWIDE